ncbi:MAG: Tryptophan synthase alpha chain, partial [Labilithrix sp.]|nr:Tryptophan synthase alpha chain [Labilithrix sp.]
MFASTITAGLIAACGSESESTFNNGASDGTEDSGPPPPPLGPTTTPDSGQVVGSDCKPRTCADQGVECGPAGDGCGGIIDSCGTCGPGLRCGGPNALSKCVSPTIGTACVPKTCAELNVECGQAGDGCGGILTCGTCAAGQQCGAVGSPSRCVAAVPTGPDGGACVKKTCTDYNAQNIDCGVQSDGCGGTTDCGQCIAPAFCGGGGPSKCAVQGGGTCTAKTCNDFPGKCGPQPNGCGGVTADCGTCTAPQVCGGGGVPSVCGGGTTQAPDGGACVPQTVCGPGQCGKVADGCGNVLDCGTGACINGTICGGGGTPNVCGAPACTPVAQCPGGMNCGSIADGCGGIVQCGNGNGCSAPQICGGGGTPNVCGGGGIAGDGGAACQPMTCAQTGKQCGPVADGCGGIVDCPICQSPAVCGGGGVPSMCGGANQCTPRTVADCPANGCGFIADGCGGLVQCGATCPNGGVCGATTPNVCGGAGGGACTGFCLNQDNTCAANSKTRITGKVYAPNGTLPLPGALVYVPNGAAQTPYGITPIVSGVANGGTCEQCNQQASGNPLVSTTTAYDGSFTLENVPAGVSFPIVIQLGKWRRMVTVGTVTKCTSATLDGSNANRPLARLPVRQNEGGNGVDNIPLVAISTGKVDGLECVFRKLGLTTRTCSGGANAGNACTRNSQCPNSQCGDSLNQFGNPPGTSSADRGRIRLYRDNEVGNANGGAVIDSNTPRTDNALTDTQAHLDQYDAVVFGCAGAANARTTERLDRVRAYADKGGRVFATHFEYVYLNTNAPWNTTATWVPNNASSGDGSWTADINTGSAKRLQFAQWLGAPGVTALSNVTPPRVSITEARNDVDQPVVAGAEEWLTRYNDPADNDAVLHYTFNTPWGVQPANQCGRVLFSDFHVTLGNTSGETFPNECDNNALTAQEKILAFFLFDLTSCIQVPPPATCTARTCANYPAGTCGVQSDGCGSTTANCGTCPNGQTCGGGGVQNQCGGPTCTPKTCQQLGAQCGVVPDGCGNTINCPDCPNGQICGGGGVANQCGVSTCTPRTCQQQGIQCGQAGDGCGNVITCNPCPAGRTCGGGGVPNQCGNPACVPLTQCPAGKNCGQYPDGCGGAINCGTCLGGMTCGGGGAPNVCGAAS